MKKPTKRTTTSALFFTGLAGGLGALLSVHLVFAVAAGGVLPMHISLLLAVTMHALMPELTLPLTVIAVALILYHTAQRQYYLSIAAATGAGAYTSYVVLEALELDGFFHVALFGFASGIACVAAGRIAFALANRTAFVVLACAIVVAAYVLAPRIADPVVEWQNARSTQQLRERTTESVNFDQYVPPDTIMKPTYHTTRNGSTVLNFTVSRADIYQGRVMQEQEGIVDPPDNCGIISLYEVMEREARRGELSGHNTPGCKIVTTSPKGRVIYGEEPQSPTWRQQQAFYTNLGNTNIIIVITQNDIDQLGTSLPEHLDVIVDSLEKTDTVFPVSDLVR